MHPPTPTAGRELLVAGEAVAAQSVLAQIFFLVIMYVFTHGFKVCVQTLVKLHVTLLYEHMIGLSGILTFLSICTGNSSKHRNGGEGSRILTDFV